MLKLLFIGDIVGKPGRDYVVRRLSEIREEWSLDLVIANGENAAGGSGITRNICEELAKAGVDAITLGDHVWDQRGFDLDINGIGNVCRPANLPEQCPGKRYLIVEHAGVRLGVLTVLWRTFMRMQSDCPFHCADRMLTDLSVQTDGVLVEIHAETTSEKIALGWYLDGRVTVVVGTHTHVPTADATILPRGTAYLTDAGMTGPYQSVLGRAVEPIVLKYLDGMPRRWPVAENDVRLCGFYVEWDPADGLAKVCRQVTLTQ